MKWSAILSVFLLTLACKQPEEVLPIRPTFNTKCLIKRIYSSSNLEPNAAHQNETETLYDYDDKWSLKKVTTIGKIFSNSTLTYRSETSETFKYNENDLLTESIVEYGSTFLYRNAPEKVRVVISYKYADSKLVEKKSKIEAFNYHGQGNELTETYQYTDGILSYYRRILGTTQSEYAVKNGIIQNYQYGASSQYSFKYELNKYGFISKFTSTELTNPPQTSIVTHEYDNLGRVIKVNTEAGEGLVSSEFFVYSYAPEPSSLIPKLKGHPDLPNPAGNGAAYNLKSSYVVRFNPKTGKEIATNYTKNYEFTLDPNGLVIARKPIKFSEESQFYEYVNCK